MNQFYEMFDACFTTEVASPSDCIMDIIDSKRLKLDSNMFRVIENMIDEPSSRLCEFIDDAFLPQSRNYYGFHEDIDTFLRDRCNEYKYVYHGTTIANALKMDHMICPKRGKLMGEFYENAKPKVFAANKNDLTTSVHSAIVWRTGQERDDVIKKGALLKLESSGFERVGDTGYHTKYGGAETDDYVSLECETIEAVLTGEDLAKVVIDNYDPLDDGLGWMSYDEFMEKYRFFDTRTQTKIDTFL